MFTKVSATRISTGTIYKLWFFGLLASMVPLGLLGGVLAAFGFNTVTWNGQPLHGVPGLIAGPFIGVFISVFITVIFGSASACGLWLFSKFRPISILVKWDAESAAG